MSRFNQLTAIVLASFLILPPAPLGAKTRKGDKLRNDARAEELKGNFDHALELAEQAMEKDPSDPAYVLEVRRVRFEAGAAHVKAGQKLRAAGKLEEALAEFQKAYGIDPASDIAEQEIRRTKEMIDRAKTGGGSADTSLNPDEKKALTPSQLARREAQQRIDSLLPVPELRPLSNDLIDLKMMNKPRVLFETVCKVAGVNVLFDPEYNQQQTIQQVQIDLSRTTLEEALDQIGFVTKSFWKPLSNNTIFVTVDNPTKRREYAEQVVKVFYLNNVTSAQEMQELLTVLRTVVDVQKVFNYTAQNALVVRAEADTMALVEKLVADLDKPRGECVIDVMVLEVSSSYMRSLAAAFAPTGITTNAVFAPRPGITTPGIQTSTPASGTTDPTVPVTTPAAGGSVTQIPFSALGRISSADYSITNLPGAQFEAVLNNSSTRILQSPQIRAADNAKASIKIGDKVPTATGSFQPGVAGVGVSPLVNTQFTFLDVGVNVDIQPRIHDNNEVSLHMELDVSQVKDRIDLGGVSEPEISQNKATADVRLKDGEVNLIGGIIQNTNSRATTGIPGLGSVPLIGKLFSAENVERNKTELVIAIIPHIVRGPDITSANLRGVAAGNQTQIKVGYAPRRSVVALPQQGVVTPPSTAAPPATAPPATAPPATAPPATAPPAPAGPPAPGGPARVSFLPGASVDTQLNQPVTVSLYAENVSDLISAAAHLQYDPRILRINNILAGDLPQKNGTQLQPSKNILNDTGAADVSVSRGPNSGGVSGSGNLFTIVFQPVGRGNTSVSVSGFSLRGSTGQPIQSNTPTALSVNVR
ncbi:MAG TPA: secretin N-terminal domain-containing protein [Bryobacteraceae bacterium]|nr:secretin N-terminal domain-containing protein [Bryobacteraceae bacterium]